MIIDPKNIFYSKNAINASIKITKYFNIQIINYTFYYNSHDF